MSNTAKEYEANKLAKIEHLVKALKKADLAAKEAEPNDDGGSANIDSVVIFLKGWRVKAIERVIELSGIRMDINPMTSWMWRGGRFVWISSNGQGYKRTKMAEAAVESLKDDGYDARCYYQMD